MRIRTAAAVLTIALTSAACASNNGSGGTGGYGGAPPTSAASSPSTQDSSGGGGKYNYGSSSPSTSGGSGPASLTVTQANYQFTPAAPSAKEGSTIRITNSTASTPHTFTITGTAIDVTIDPSTSQTVKLDLPPGTYPFICRYHVSSGMKGTLTVSPT